MSGLDRGDRRATVREASDAAYRPSAAPLAFWAVLLGALAALQAGFGGLLLPVLVQAGAAALIGLIALAIFVGSIVGRSGGQPGRRMVPDLSLATVLTTVSVAAMLAGATVGTWLILGGFLGLMLGTGGLLREHRAVHRSRRAREAAPASGRAAPEGGES
jgi:hypothetical protein